ncbi:hypothetical protein HHI36_009161 [Cryptolaemus montrouzieri]|uniref:DNA oxidative demethylase ALKBH2 n=1 Tax=Cryptolaemus montrouzieri TaxID=559131 RepID=A0ABD2MUK4_9CUCU
MNLYEHWETHHEHSKIDLKTAFEAIVPNNLEKKKIIREGLNLDYMILLNRTLANELFNQLRASVEYYDGELTKVRVFGKWHKIPRQQCAYGDAGLNYKFSGVCLPAKEWLPPLIAIRKLLLRVTGHDYNFVLINRYRDGTDHMGEHKDDEAELDPNTPIASLSLGQERPFVLDTETVGKRSRKGNHSSFENELGAWQLITHESTYQQILVPFPAEKKNCTWRKNQSHIQKN